MDESDNHGSAYVDVRYQLGAEGYRHLCDLRDDLLMLCAGMAHYMPKEPGMAAVRGTLVDWLKNFACTLGDVLNEASKVQGDLDHALPAKAWRH
ncbi:hypothetical protein DWU98_14470 [Dyella monticola]|uniref:Uncharacterized protein n=1 Tax=Dyella monticola TaxID=1927958 RepID=A0A370WVX7_9GAMM|nr:hypothetical protein [Dyella monticola]RDS80115.1 hypothetical protein DWU98_14470 [Dyella monticola]